MALGEKLRSGMRDGRHSGFWRKRMEYPTGLAFGAGCDSAKMRGLVTLVRFQAPKDGYMHLGQTLFRQQGHSHSSIGNEGQQHHTVSNISCWSPLLLDRFSQVFF